MGAPYIYDISRLRVKPASLHTVKDGIMAANHSIPADMKSCNNYDSQAGTVETPHSCGTPKKKKKGQHPSNAKSTMMQFHQACWSCE